MRDIIAPNGGDSLVLMIQLILINRVERSATDAIKDHEENQSGLLLKALQQGEFSHLQEDPRMTQIIEKLMAQPLYSRRSLGVFYGRIEK